MAMDSLASAAHAAGFAMALSDDLSGNGSTAGAVTVKADADEVLYAGHAGPAVNPKAVLSEALERWQGSTRPLDDAPAARSGGVFDWMPKNFSWRADGR